MAGERLTDMLMDSVFPPTTRDAVQLAMVQQLGELQALRGDELTEEEWRDSRQAILNDLVSYPRAAWVMFIASLACVYIPGGVLIAAIVYGLWQLAVAGVGALLLWGAIAYRQGKTFAVRRGLSAEDRHAVVDALVALSLVSADEAAELHRRVDERPSSPGEPEARGDGGGM